MLGPVSKLIKQRTDPPTTYGDILRSKSPIRVPGSCAPLVAVQSFSSSATLENCGSFTASTSRGKLTILAGAVLGPPNVSSSLDGDRLGM